MSLLDSNVEWYVDWLKERNPEWTDEQRLEIATGFALLQEPPRRPETEPEETSEQSEPSAADVRAKTRKDERMLHGYIGNLLKEAGE